MNGNDNYRDDESPKQKKERLRQEMQSRHNAEGMLALLVTPIRFVFMHLPAAIPAWIATYYTTSLFSSLGGFGFAIALVLSFAVYTFLFWQLIKQLHEASEKAGTPTMRKLGTVAVMLYIFTAYAVPAWFISSQFMPENFLVNLLIGAGIGFTGAIFYQKKIKNIDFMQAKDPLSSFGHMDSLQKVHDKEVREFEKEDRIL